MLFLISKKSYPPTEQDVIDHCRANMAHSKVPRTVTFRELSKISAGSWKYAEKICAWIIPAHGAKVSLEDVGAHCEGQFVHFKTPRYARTVTESPMTAMEKPRKFPMREKMVSELDLGETSTA